MTGLLHKWWIHLKRIAYIARPNPANMWIDILVAEYNQAWKRAIVLVLFWNSPLKNAATGTVKSIGGWMHKRVKKSRIKLIAKKVPKLGGHLKRSCKNSNRTKLLPTNNGISLQSEFVIKLTGPKLTTKTLANDYYVRCLLLRFTVRKKKKKKSAPHSSFCVTHRKQIFLYEFHPTHSTQTDKA